MRFKRDEDSLFHGAFVEDKTAGEEEALNEALQVAKGGC